MEPEQQNESEQQRWERDVINRLSFAALNEQRRARRWNIFFKLLLFGYLFVLLFIGMQGDSFTESKLVSGEHTALVEVHGIISDATKASADNIIEGLRDAFEAKRSKGVILRINSPGGSPVQSGYVYDEMMRLRKKYPDKPLHAVIVDTGASGGYFMAAAAENIYVNQSSIIGSIGVLMNGFGFVEALDKLGIERRLMTAGEHKGTLDPFSPLKEAEVEHVDKLLESIHQQFIQSVKEGRGERLKESPEIFSGLFWTGEEGIELGLADALGDADYVAREVIKAEDIVDYTPQPDLFKRFSDRLGTAMANVLSEKIGMQQTFGLK
jgi:protease-4